MLFHRHHYVGTIGETFPENHGRNELADYDV